MGTSGVDRDQYQKIIDDQIARLDPAPDQLSRTIDATVAHMLRFIEDRYADPQAREAELAAARLAGERVRERLAVGTLGTGQREAAPTPPARQARVERAEPPRPAPSRFMAFALAGVIGLAAGLLGAYAYSLFAAPPYVGDGSFVGRYIWSNGADVELRPDGTFLWNRERVGYYYRTSPLNIIMVHQDGRAVDYLTADAPYGQLRRA